LHTERQLSTGTLYGGETPYMGTQQQRETIINQYPCMKKKTPKGKKQ